MAFESQSVRDARIDVAAVLGAVLKRLPITIIVTLALLAATFVVLMFMPRLYESSASILVEPRGNIFTRSANEQAPTSSSDTGVVSSQIELLKSRDTLMTVVDKLDLRSVPEFNGSEGGGFSPMAMVSQMLGRRVTPVSVDERVVNTLYDRLTVIQERDSRIISVLVRSTNPQLAADIANAVAEAHVARRAQLSISDTADASNWLADEIAKLRVSVTEAETAVANFKVANDLFIGTNNTSLLDQNLSTIATQISAAQERKNAALSRAALIRGMIERGQSIDGVGDVRDSVVVQQLSQEKARLQGEKAQRSATLLSNHPTIQALNAQISELNSQISIEGRRVVQALETEAQIEADLEKSLQGDLARVKSSASTATTDTVELDSLQREAKAQRDLLESYLQRYSEAASRVDSNSALPDVRVVSLAAPSVTPASPKTNLILLAVGIVALAGQLGFIVFGELMSGRAIVPGGRVAIPEIEDAPPQAPGADKRLEQKREAREAVVAKAAAPLVSQESEAVDPIGESVAAPAEMITEVNPDPERVAQLSPEPQPQPVAHRAPTVTLLPDLLSDLVLGRTHLLILAAHENNSDCEALAEELVGDALARGLSVALIDAGSARAGDEPGLADLSVDAATFGDVVHKSADNSFAEVPWGQGATIDLESNKPFTLVEALGDIYEVVVLMTGRVGRTSALPAFDGLDGRLVLVASDDDNFDEVTQTRDLLLEAGFDQCDITAAPSRAAA